MKLDGIIKEVETILETVDIPNMSYDEDDRLWIAIKGLRYLLSRLRLKNARIMANLKG